MLHLSRVSLALGVALAAGCDTESDPSAPSVAEVAPGALCAGSAGRVPISIRGDSFSTAPKPTVEFRSLEGAALLVPESLVTSVTANQIVALVDDSALAPADCEPPNAFEVTVTNADGQSSAPAPAYLLEAPPRVTSVADGTTEPIDTAFGVRGCGFHGDITVTIESTPPVTARTVVEANAREALAAFDLSEVAPGTYDVTVETAHGCGTTTEALLTVTDPS